MEEKFILNIGKKEAFCIKVRNHFYGGNWDKMLKDIATGQLKGIISPKTVQLLQNYEEVNQIDFSQVPLQSDEQSSCSYRHKHRRVKNCLRRL